MTERKELTFQSSVSEVRGIGAKKQERLENLGIHTVEDLLMHFPFRFRDRRSPVSPLYAPEGKEVLVCGTLMRKGIRHISGGRTMATFTFRGDDCGFVAVFFNASFMMKNLDNGKEYSVFGRLSRKNGAVTFINPEVSEKGGPKDVRGIIPVYRCTSGITSNDLIKWIRDSLERCISLDQEWLDPGLTEKRKLCGLRYAFTNIHFPEGEHKYGAARYRIVYEKLLAYQVAVKRDTRLMRGSGDGAMEFTDPSGFLERLPFKLTKGQAEAVASISRDLRDEKPMNRLIQGDVGCGKTAVAEAGIFMAWKSGKQSAVMAPTEILARQHYRDMKSALEPFGVKCALLVSSIKASERREVLEDLAGGNVDLIIGTQALLQDDVVFHDLGLVVTDEQHRFGVHQRRILTEKAVGVNVLVMSATPIPRTLASTVFGDMDFSTIRTMPASRLPVITRGVTGSSRKMAYAAVREQLSRGHQAYVVAPSIDDEGELNSATALYDEMKKLFPGYKVLLLHGRMTKDEKERIMEDFSRGKGDILVSTVVIEVGINVPGASIIVIENSERFGLAQLHQLRGRVGRSNIQSYCYLVNYGRSPQSAERIKIMTETSDGFTIAQEDYRLRGPGDIMGTMQHGSAAFVSDLMRYPEILKAAEEDAVEILDGRYDKTDWSRMEEMIRSLSVSDNSDVL